MGMRRGEIFGLKWADIDLDRAVLYVRRSYVDGVVGPPKTESSRRPLPLPPQVVEALTIWKEKTLFSHAEDWVFASEYSFGKQPLWPGTLWQRNVAPAIQRAGITKPKLGWHTLRRSYASLLRSSGASLCVSMELMRHSTAEITLSGHDRISLLAEILTEVPAHHLSEMPTSRTSDEKRVCRDSSLITSGYPVIQPEQTERNNKARAAYLLCSR
jgi:integrase